MLSKKRRLNHRIIREILKKGKSARAGNISLKYLVFPGQTPSFSFVVSSKTVKSAVIRNKLKRRGRAAVFSLLPSIREGRQGLVFFGKGSERLKFPAIKKEIVQLFQKANFFV